MTTPPDPEKGGHRSDTLVNDRPPIEDRPAPYRSDEATAVNHQLSEELDVDVDATGLVDEASSDGDTGRYDPHRTLAAEEISGPGGAEISGKNRAAPVEASGKIARAEVSGPVPRAPEAPTLVHRQTLIDDDDDDDDAEPTDDGETERLRAPPPLPPLAPLTNVGPLPERSPGASRLAGSPEDDAGAAPRVQQWRVVPSGVSAAVPAAPVTPPRPRGLQTVLWTMQPMADDNDDESSEEHRVPYDTSGNTVARAAQTYILEAMDLLDGLRAFAGDLDGERSRELLSTLTGCSDRLRRAMALLATSGDDDE